MSFLYKINANDDIVLINLSGSLIGKNQIEELLTELDFFINEGKSKVILDLSEMNYMNSTGLSVLINIFTQVRNKGGEVVLVNIPEKINKLLLITKLNSIFNVENTVEDAKKVLM